MIYVRISGFPAYEVEKGILADEAIMMLRRFYVRENDHGLLH
jgi:hypothetical protein